MVAFPLLEPRFGLTMPTIPGDLRPLVVRVGQLGVHPGIVMWYEQWSSAPDFPLVAARAVAESGAVPEITWEPWDPARGVRQRSYSLASIARGSHDRYLTTWASGIRSFGGPLRLRFAHEMNGGWYPWGEGVNGNRRGSFVAAWRHVHDVLAGAGCENVDWVWSPNVAYPGSIPFGQVWPGAPYVTTVGLDGYNWGPTHASGWQAFRQVFAPSVSALRAATGLPVWIAEVATSGADGDKAAWMADMFTTLAAWPEVSGFTWFDYDKENDWRIDSSPASLDAFRTGLTTLGR